MKIKLFTLFLAALLLIAGCSNDTTKSTKQDSKENEVKIAKVMIKKENAQNFYVVATPVSGTNLIYAYHVLKDNKVIKKQSYTQDAYFTYKIKTPGTYKVRVFLKDAHGKKIIFKDTQTIKM